MCKDVGMQVFGSYIVGLPGETKETLMDTHKFAQELGVLYGYHFLSPFPGTAIKDEIDTYDLQLLTDDWSRFDANQPIVKTAGISPEDTLAFVEEYYNKKDRLDKENLYKRYQEGCCTPAEWLIIKGNQKLDVVSALLSQDIIESLEPFQSSNGKDNSMLVDAITQRTSIQPEIVSHAIGYLVDQGYLKKNKKEGLTRWEWA